MTTLARTFVSIPERSGSETWAAICALLAPDTSSSAHAELASIRGVASSLIARESMVSPIIVYGSGPRVRVYCLYNEDALEGDDKNETSLPFTPTTGEWRMSLPCPSDELQWVGDALKEKTHRVTARDMEEKLETETESKAKSAASDLDLEAFLKL